MELTSSMQLLIVVFFIFLFRALVIGIARTIVSVILGLLRGTPIRVDLPIPFFPVDIVLVNKPEHISAIASSPPTIVGRLHSCDTEKLPPWAKIFFGSSRFFSRLDGTWFIPFENETKETRYASRLQLMTDALSARPHTKADLQKVKELVAKGDIEALRVYVVSMVNDRFNGGEKIPPEIVSSGRATIDKIPQVLNPIKYRAAIAGNLAVSNWVQSRHLKGLNVVDASHNICVLSKYFAEMIMALKNNPNGTLEYIFTQEKKNIPTPMVPRIAVTESNLGGLLRYNAVPFRTVFLLGIGKAAKATGDLRYTFGCNINYRQCAFMPYWKSFMEDLQAVLYDDMT
eukprot:jgi/Botrbrau1/17151/Bobra.0157s0045.1